MPVMYLFNGLNPNICSFQYPSGRICRLVIEGTAKSTARPDIAHAILGVINEKLQLTAAQQENAAQTTAVINAVLRAGVASENIQTQVYSIDTIYDYIDGKQVFRGYRVIHKLSVTLQNVNKAGEIIDAAVGAGANTVDGVTFSVSNPSMFYRNALNSAINDAIEKAAFIGSKLNVQISSVPVEINAQSIQESIPIEPFQIQAATTPVQPGQVEITANIKAVFVYSL